MEPGKNTVIVSTKKLFHYDKVRKEEGKDWDEVDWDQDLEGEYSEDCDTQIKIINRSNPVWKEMFEMQKRTDGQKFCDVNLLGTNGYVPCHRVVLMEKSDFLTKLITNNMKINVPFSGHKDLNNIISICIDVDADILKHVVTLFYTGFCIVANSKEGEEVKDILKILQVDIKDMTILDAATSSTTIKKKKIRSATVCRFADADQQETQSSSATKRQTAPCSTVMAGSSNGIRPSSSSQNQMPGPSPAAASSSRGFSDPLPEIKKIPPGSYPKKPAERIQRNTDDKPSTTSSGPIRPPVQDDSDSDNPDALRAPMPVVQKVPPGTLLPLNKQPRIIRSIARGGRRRRGRGMRGGRGRGYATRSTDPGTANEPEDEDSSGPKGRYERDNDYVPSGGDEFIEEEDVELESVGESTELSDSEDRRPRTRLSTPRLDEEHGRYPKRRRREEGSYAKIVSGQPNEDRSSPTKSIEIENSPRESLMDAHRPARTRGTTVSPNNKLRSLTSHVDEISQPQCVDCKQVFQELEELKLHLDTTCGKHYAGQYDIIKQYCVTCKSYFKKYTLKEFLEHVQMCVLSASVRSRRISSKSTDSNQVASTSTSPVRPVPVHSTRMEEEPEPPAPDVKHIAIKQKERCDFIGLIPAKPLIDNLSVQQIERLKQKLKQGKDVTSSQHPGLKYVFPRVNSDEDKKEKENKNSDTPASTQHTPTVKQTTAPRVEPTPAISVVKPPVPRVEQTPPPPSVPNETLPSVSASAFIPDFTSTPLSPKAKEDQADHKTRRTGRLSKPRPGPLRSKSKAVASETENNGHKRQEKQDTTDGYKNQTSTNSKPQSNSQDATKLPAINEIDNNIQDGTVVTALPPPSNEPKENSGSLANATCKGTGTAALNATASRLKATLKKKLNNSQSCSNFAGDTPQNNTTTLAAVTAADGPNKQFEGLKTVNSTSEGAQSVESDRTHVPSQKSDVEKVVKTTTAGAIYNKTMEQLVSSTENTSPMSTGGQLKSASNVLEHNQQRYSPISSASSRTSTPESRMTPISLQQQQQQQLASTGATTTGPPLYLDADSGPRIGVALTSTSALAPPPATTSHVVAFTSASQNLVTLLQSNPGQSSTPVNAMPVMQQVQTVRFPGQQPIAIRSRHHNTAVRSQSLPRVQSVPPAMPLGSGIQYLTSQTTIRPVINSSVAKVSLFPQTRNPIVTRTQNTYNEQALPETTNASLEFEGGLEVRRLNAPQPTVRTVSPAAQPTVRTASPAVQPTVRTASPAAQPTVRTASPAAQPTVRTASPAVQPTVHSVSPANVHTQQTYQQQQQQRYTPPTTMNSMQQYLNHPLPPTSAAVMQQTYISTNTGTSQTRQSPILNNAQPRLPIASTVSQQGYQYMVPQSQQSVHYGNFQQNSQAQHTQFIRPMSAPIQNQALPTAAVPSVQQYTPISQNRPVSSAAVLPQSQQYQQVSSTPAMPPNSQYVPATSTAAMPPNSQYVPTTSTAAMPPNPQYVPASSTLAVSYQQHQPSGQGVPVSRSVHNTHDGMLYSRVATAPPSSTPNVSIMQNGAGGYMSSQVNNNGNGSSATVRLPITPFMNPLVNNRSGQSVVQQQPRQLHQIPQSASQINSVQSLAPVAPLSSNLTSGGQSSSEPGNVTCEDCGDIFETKQSYDDHKNDGFC